MKYIKNFEYFSINEKYNSLTKFYHITDRKNLQSLLKGIEINKAGTWGQGNGLYVFNNESKAEEPDGIGSRLVNTMIELETILNEDNFDIDYEKDYGHELYKMNHANKILDELIDIING